MGLLEARQATEVCDPSRGVGAMTVRVSACTSKLFSLLRRLWQEEHGPTAVEYAVLLGIISAAVFVSLDSLGMKTSGVYSTVSQELVNSGGDDSGGGGGDDDAGGNGDSDNNEDDEDSGGGRGRKRGGGGGGGGRGRGRGR